MNFLERLGYLVRPDHISQADMIDASRELAALVAALDKRVSELERAVERDS